MPKIVDYPEVLQRLAEQGLRCLYHNSGSFGFAPDLRVLMRGWIGPDDPTIRPAAMEQAVRIQPPYEQRLAQMFTATWQELPSQLWIMPGSHWTYELDFGSASWLPEALLQSQIDPAALQARNNGSAIAFDLGQAHLATSFTERLLHNLVGSDFVLAFPDRPVVCLLHHHKQLWWQTTDAAFYEQIKSAELF